MARFCLAWLICFVITVSRDIDALMKPVLWAEDSVAIFANYYNVSGIPLVRYWGGYVSLAADLIGYAVSCFPTVWQPHMLPGIAIAVSAAAFALFAAPIFRKIVVSDTQRFIIAVALAVLPLGSFADVGLVGYTQWPAGILLVLLAAVAPDLSLRSIKGAALFLLLLVLVWTNPVSIIALPLFLYEAWRTRAGAPSSALANLMLAAGCVLYVTVGRVYAPADVNVLHALSDGTRLLLERVVFESVFGTMTRMWALAGAYWLWMDIIAVGAIAVTMFGLRHRMRDPQFRTFLLKAAYLSIGICYLSALMRADVGLSVYHGRRYPFISGAMFTLLFLIALTDAATPLTTVRKLSAGAAIVVALAVTNAYNNWLYQTPSRYWPRFRAFIQSVAAAEKEGRAVTLTLEGEEREGWPIIVHVRPR